MELVFLKYLNKDSNPLLILNGKKDTVQKFYLNKPEVEKARTRSSKVSVHNYENAGHSWDCSGCKKDGFNQEVDNDALKRTLKFFKENRTKIKQGRSVARCPLTWIYYPYILTKMI